MSASAPPAPAPSSTTTIDHGIDAWKVALIDERARRRGYRREELPDLRQDLAPVIAAFRFDAAKSNGACERTVLVSIIDRQLAMALRTRARWQRFRTEYSDVCATAERQRAERREVAHEIEVDRATDVASALITLAPVEQTVARALMKGERLSAIAKRLGRTRYDIERLLERIRDHFRTCGLDAWVSG